MQQNQCLALSANMTHFCGIDLIPESWRSDSPFTKEKGAELKPNPSRF